MAGTPGPATQQDSTPNAARNPIVSALHDMAVSVLGDQLRAMFEKADDILFDSAEKARSNDEQRLYLDTMRIVRVQRAQILKAFRESLEKALAQVGDEDGTSSQPDDVADMSQWSLQDGDVLEERLAVSNMETKAASLHANELVELQRRLARLSDITGGGLSPEAMAPARIIRAFQQSVHDLQVDFPIKLVIYKLFDRVVVGGMSEMFSHANQLLAGHGVEPKESAVPAEAARRGAAGFASSFAQGDTRAGSSAQDSSGAPAGAPMPPAWAHGFDAGRFTQFMGAPQTPWGGSFSMPSGSPGGFPGANPSAGYPASWPPYAPGYATPPVAGPPSNYDDAWLAHDIGHILQSYANGQAPSSAPAWLPPQNVGLVARMFDGYYSDPRLPDALKPLLARLQMPVMKAALSDPQFFADVAHPARRASNSLYELALQLGASGGALPEQTVHDLESLVDEVARAFELDPTRLKAQAADAVAEDVADSFLREQDQTQQSRNRQEIERVRRIVAHELKMRVGERDLPSGVMRLMLAGFGPRLCVDYIRDGIEGKAWKLTMTLVERVLGSLDNGAVSTERRAHDEAEIIAAVTHRLADVGFAKSKLEDVVAGLVEAYLQPRPAAGNEMHAADPSAAVVVDNDNDEYDKPAPAVPAPPRLSAEQELSGLLSIVLLPGGWFTIVEAGTQTKHWMRVRAYYPAQHLVLFGHYMEERFLKIRVAGFASELAAGRIAAIDPAPDLQNAIARIAALPLAAEPVGTLNWIQGAG